jgi:hypothetical protein
MYLINREYGDKFYWICDLYKSTFCRGRLITELNAAGEHVILKKSKHIHSPSIHRSFVAEAKSNLREISTQDLNSSATRLVDQNNASDFVIQNNLSNFMGSNHSQKMIVRRARQSHGKIKYPPNPTSKDFVYDLNFEDLYLHEEQILLFDCLSEDKSKRLTIFTTDFLFERFCAATFTVYDGTFKTCPAPYTQLFICHGNLPGFDEYFTHPMIYVLMTGKDENMYETIFNELRQTAIKMGLTINAKYSMTDFELASRKALRLIFPPTQNRACFFHLRQLAIKRLKNLKTISRVNGQPQTLYKKYISNPDFAFEINQVLALAFFPPNEIEELFNVIHRFASTDALVFYNWFKPLYIRKLNGQDAISPPSFWSVYDLVMLGYPKTSNGAEQSHHSLFSACNKIPHLPLYKFISILKGQIIKTQQIIDRIFNGLIEKRRSKFHEEKEKIIHHILETKDVNNKPLIYSLRAIATSLTSFMHLLIQPN